MKLVRITKETAARYGAAIAALEKNTTYPLGSDFFTIDHGSDYFAFFQRLGDMHYYAAVDEKNGDAIAAVATGIIRSKPLRTWYLCDLKVHPGYRGRHLPIWMLKRAFFQNYVKCPRGYAISMNSKSGGPNRVARILAKFPWVPIRSAGEILLFELSAAEMTDVAPLLTKHRGPLSYLSLQGKKDIVLQSTGRPMPLLHVQHGPCAEQGIAHPQEGSVHMFCVPAADRELLQALEEKNLKPSASATLIQHRMTKQDWKFILTSDI